MSTGGEITTFSELRSYLTTPMESIFESMEIIEILSGQSQPFPNWKTRVRTINRTKSPQALKHEMEWEVFLFFLKKESTMSTYKRKYSEILHFKPFFIVIHDICPIALYMHL